MKELKNIIETEKKVEIIDYARLRNLNVLENSLVFMILLMQFTEFNITTLCVGLILGFFTRLISNIDHKLKKDKNVSK